MTLSLALVALLSQQPLPPTAPRELPPGHPPLTGSAPAAPPPTSAPGGAALPPNHPNITGAASGTGRAPSMEELVKQLDATPGLKEKDRPFELSTSIGHLYFSQGRYADAAVFFEQAVKKMEPLRTLWAAQVKAAGKTQPKPAAELGCGEGPEQTLELLRQKAETYAQEKNAAAAATCAMTALKALKELEPSLGDARALIHDVKGAQAAYESALAFDAGNLDARYGRAALLLDTQGNDVKSLKLVKGELERVVAEAAYPKRKHAQRLLERTTAALAAGGVAKLPLAQGPAPEHPTPAARPQMMPPMMGGGSDSAPALAPGVAEAFKGQQGTPEAARQVEALCVAGEEALAKGEFQKALDSFKGGMPIAPDNGRLRAGLAWSLDRLGKPTAERIWSVAVTDPESIARLTDTLEAKGDAAGAKALRQKLVGSVPSMAARFAGKL